MPPKKTECKNFKLGACTFGDQCYFSHSVMAAAAATPPARVCKNYQETGSCHFGGRCHFSHEAAATTPAPAPVLLPCRTWVVSGSCQQESFCAFQHSGWDPQPLVHPRPGAPNEHTLMDMVGANATVYRDNATMADLMSYFRGVFVKSLDPPGDIIAHYADCNYVLAAACPNILTDLAACGLDATLYSPLEPNAAWLERYPAVFTRYGILQALEKRRVSMEEWEKKTLAEGRAFEALSVVGGTEEMSPCERQMVAHTVAMILRDPYDGRVSQFGSLPGAAGGYRNQETYVNQWPSEGEIDAWCAWTLHCRRRAAADLDGFTFFCQEQGHPLLLIVRNVAATKAFSSWNAEFDAVMYEAVNNIVLTIVEVKNGPWGLPKSLLQRNRVVRTILGAEAMTFSHSDTNCLGLSLRQDAFQLFSQQPEWRWVTACQYRPYQPGEKPRSGMQPYLRRCAYEAVAAAIGTFGYIPGMSADALALVVSAFLADDIVLQRISEKVVTRWREEQAGNKWVRPPAFCVKECIRLGCWNLIVW